MSDAVTQETLRVLLPSKVALAVDEISRKTGKDALEVLPSFYASHVYRELENEKSKFWCFSPAELCDLFLAER